jgi:exosortase
MSTTVHPHDLPIEPPAVLGLTSKIRDVMANDERRTQILGAALLCGLLGVMYAANLRHFVYTWSTDDNYTHGFLVPLLSLYFAREAAKRGPIASGGGPALGITLLVASILARLATIVVPVGMVGDLGFVIGVAGLCALIGGRGALRRYGFAIGFLVFMLPLPVALYSALASPLQLMVSRMGSVALNALGVPVLCEGNMMTLPGGTKMFVAEACSGMRQLTGFLALTTAVAYLAARPAWYRAVLVASSVPIAMTANVLRVTLTGVIMHRFDPKYASGNFHTVEGLLMMAVGLGLLGLECYALNSLCACGVDRPTQLAQTKAGHATLVG